jgi:hypothetical protein
MGIGPAVEGSYPNSSKELDAAVIFVEHSENEQRASSEGDLAALHITGHKDDGARICLCV